MQRFSCENLVSLDHNAYRLYTRRGEPRHGKPRNWKTNTGALMPVLGILAFALFLYGVLEGTILLVYFWHLIFLSIALGVIACWIVFWFVLQNTAAQLVSYMNIEHIVTTELVGDYIHLTVDREKIDKRSKSDFLMISSLSVAMGTTWIVLFVAYASGSFDVQTFMDAGNRTHSSTHFFFTIILASMVTFIASFLCIVEWADKLLDQFIDTTLHERFRARTITIPDVGRLYSLQHDLDVLHRKLGVTSPDNYYERAKTRIEARGSKVFRDPKSAASDIQEGIVKAQKYEKVLKHAATLYASAIKRCGQAEAAVIKSDSKSLTELFEELSSGLHSITLKTLIENRQWKDFCDIVSTFADDFDALRDEARSSAGRSRAADGEITAEQAYSILNVPPTATDEHIKRAYKLLCTLWHPDIRLVNDDARMKEINRAYEFVMKER